MLIATSDGVDVRAYDEGGGPLIVLLGPGLDDGTRDRRLARILARRFRVVRLHRRQYRLDLSGRGPWPISAEVDDVVAVVERLGGPALLYGHSDGGVVALEALATEPSLFAGAVIFEPPAGVLGHPLSGSDRDLLNRVQALGEQGRLRQSLAVFLREVVGLPLWEATLAAMFSVLVPRYRRLIPAQINSFIALDQLGERLDGYAEIHQPTVLLGADRSPGSPRRQARCAGSGAV